MSARVEIDEQWIDEQLKHFPPGSMDGFVRQLRAFERADRRRTSSERKGGVAA